MQFMDRYDFKKRILFIGVPDMGYIGLDTLYYAGVNIVGVMGPLKSHNTYFSFKNFVKMHNLNFIEYDSLDSPDFLNIIRNLNIDLAVVCSFNNKIPLSFINEIKDGIINLHPSLLPDYRGGNPYSRVIMNGETETGVTLHFMSENFDEGDIICQEKCPITENETMGTLFDKTNKLGCRMLLDTLLKYERENVLPRKKQPAGIFKPAKNLSEREQFIDYNKTAVEIERFVRALNPYMPAMTIFRNQILKVYKVKCSDIRLERNFKTGEICHISGNDICINTQKGVIIPEVIQFGGLFVGNSKDFAAIIQPEIGECFRNG